MSQPTEPGTYHPDLSNIPDDCIVATPVGDVDPNWVDKRTPEQIEIDARTANAVNFDERRAEPVFEDGENSIRVEGDSLETIQYGVDPNMPPMGIQVQYRAGKQLGIALVEYGAPYVDVTVTDLQGNKWRMHGGTQGFDTQLFKNGEVVKDVDHLIYDVRSSSQPTIVYTTTDGRGYEIVDGCDVVEAPGAEMLGNTDPEN